MTHSCDVYRINLEKNNQIVNVEISNVISWELVNLKATKEELKGIADFILEFLKEN